MARNRLTLTDTIQGSNGARNTYLYDALDRLTRLTQTSTLGAVNPIVSKRVDFGYNLLGQFTTIARFADLAGAQSVASTSYSYDALNRLTDIKHRNPTSTILNSFAFQYDAASRVTRITDIDGPTDFQYDTRDQLTAAMRSDPSNIDETYAYDGTGNRLSSQRHGSRYLVGDGIAGTADTNRLTSDGTYSYLYDAEGNLIRRTHIANGTVRDFAWDHRNRLIRLTDRPSVGGQPTQLVEFTYDALNRRIAKKVDFTPTDTVDGTIIYYVYDGSDVLAELSDADGSGPAPATELMRYLHGPAVDQVLAQEDSTDNIEWMLADHLGTVRDLVNNSGTVVNHLKYDSYGNLISESNSTFKTRYRFTGREFDAETSLQYFRARYYDASIGRFVSEDPIGFAGADSNFYRYVSNAPNYASDPSGLAKEGAASKLKGANEKGKSLGKKASGYLDTVGNIIDGIIGPIQRAKQRLKNLPNTLNLSEQGYIEDYLASDRQIKEDTVAAGVCGVNEIAKPLILDRIPGSDLPGKFDEAKAAFDSNPLVASIMAELERRSLEKQVAAARTASARARSREIDRLLWGR